MLRSVNDLYGYTVQATDGEIGSVDKFFFDDQTWTIRYLVVDTGTWLPGRQVLISPISLIRTDWTAQRLYVALTKEQIEKSPGIDTHKPVSRQREIEQLDYYGYPYYWYGTGLWGPAAYPAALGVPTAMGYPDKMGIASGRAASGVERQAAPHKEQGDPHLRSTKEVIGYYIEAQDGEIGHVEDFIIDDKSWAIRYMIVDTVNWWPGKKVLIAPQWVEQVKWAESRVSVDLSREQIKNAPEYDPLALMSGDYEERLYAHYGRPKYFL